MPKIFIDDFSFSRDPVNPNLKLIKDRLRDYGEGDLNLSCLSINDDDLIIILRYLKANKINISGHFDLSGNAFTTLPTGLFNQVVVNGGLYLSDNLALITTSKGAFQGCSIGGCLYISRNSALTTIAEGAFQGCLIGWSLLLSSNRALTTISKGAFQGCSIGENLCLDHNSALTTLSEGAFQGCSIGGILYFYDNPALASIPLSAFENASISNINGSYYSIILDSENNVVSQQDFISFLTTEGKKFSVYLMNNTPLSHILLSPNISFPLIRPDLTVERQAFYQDLERIWILMHWLVQTNKQGKTENLPCLPSEMWANIFSFLFFLPLPLIGPKSKASDFLERPLQEIRTFESRKDAALFCDQLRKDMQASRNTSQREIQVNQFE